MSFVNLSLTKKFGILTTLSILALVVMSSSIYLQTEASKSLNHHMTQKDFPVLIKAHEMQMVVIQVQQFLTDISATRGMNGLNDGFDLAAQNARRFLVLSQEMNALLPDKQATLTKIANAFNHYYDVGKKMAQDYVKKGPEQGNAMMPEFDAVAETLTKYLEPFIKTTVNQVHHQLDEAQKKGQTTEKLVLGTSVILTLIGGFLLFNIRSLITDLVKISSIVKEVAQGRINGKCIQLKRQDEIGALAGDIELMRSNINSMVTHIKESSAAISSTSSSLVTIAQGTADHIQTEKNEITHIASAMNEMLMASQEVASNAERAAKAAADARLETHNGDEMAQKTITAVSSLADDVANSTSVIRELHGKSQTIDRIIDVINDIAEQTNLLALNAAIEAARAGEQGRGFAVVADEVRTLAQRTQTSTGEISDMIEDLQTTASNTVQAMEHGQQRAQTSVEYVTSVGKELNAIGHSVSSITDMIDCIASASTEQSMACEEINRNICNINDAAENTLAQAQELNAANTEVSEIAKRLETGIRRFHTS